MIESEVSFIHDKLINAQLLLVIKKNIKIAFGLTLKDIDILFSFFLRPIIPINFNKEWVISF